MPRIARVAPGGIVQHVLNRGNGRMKLFHKPADYLAFTKLLAEAQRRVAGVRLLGWCLMPNHWHLALWPRAPGDLSAFMRWLSNTHVRRWPQHWHTVGEGHVYQGRFKNFPIQNDAHLLTVLRYVESNPRRARMVQRAESWPWSSLHDAPPPAAAEAKGKTEPAPTREPGSWPVLSDSPVPRPRDWLELINQPLPKEQLAAVRESLKRGRPFGDPAWTTRTADRLGLQFTIRPRGRPKKKEK